MNDSTNIKVGSATSVSVLRVPDDDSLSITITPAVMSYLAAGNVLEGCYVNPVTGCLGIFVMTEKPSPAQRCTCVTGLCEG